MYVPAAQAAQLRSAVADGVLLTDVPAAHVAHAAQLAAFVLVLNVPLAQPAQRWSVVALPGAETYCPAAQLVCDTQGVAGSPSWSQVPAAQATAGAVSPAQ